MTKKLEVEAVALPTLPVKYEAAALEALYRQVEEEVSGEVPDIETVEGRKRIKSLAADVAKSRTMIDTPIRDHLRELKAIPKILEKNARESVERFDTLKQKILAPLEAAQRPQEAIIERMGEIVSLCAQNGATSDSLRLLSIEIEGVDVDATFWPELKKKAQLAYDNALQTVTVTLERLQRDESQAAELEALRVEKECRDEADRVRAIEEAAKKRAEQEAEQRRIDDLAAAKRREDALQLQASNERQQREEAERNAAAQQEQHKRNQEAAAELAEQQRLAAIEQAKKDEQARHQQAAKDAQDELDRRAADKAHRGAKHREALVALIAEVEGVEEALGKLIITAIATGKITNIKVHY